MRLVYRRDIDTISISASGDIPAGYTLHFAPAIGIGSQVRSVTADGVPVPFDQVEGAQTIQPLVDLALDSQPHCSVVFDAAPEIIAPDPPARTGETNSGIKLLSATREGDIAPAGNGGSFREGIRCSDHTDGQDCVGCRCEAGRGSAAHCFP